MYALKQCPIHGAVSPIARIHRSMNQGVEMGTAHYCLSHPLATFLLPVAMILFSADLEVFVPKGEIVLLGDTTIILLN